MFICDLIDDRNERKTFSLVVRNASILMRKKNIVSDEDVDFNKSFSFGSKKKQKIFNDEKEFISTKRTREDPNAQVQTR